MEQPVLVKTFSQRQSIIGFVITDYYFLLYEICTWFRNDINSEIHLDTNSFDDHLLLVLADSVLLETIRTWNRVWFHSKVADYVN